MQSGLYLSTSAIAVALALDLVLGDPSWMPHPVRFIGRAVTWGEARLRTGEPRADLWRGALLAYAVVILTAVAAWVAVAIASTVANWLGLAAAVLIAWTTLALNGLDRAAGEVEGTLGCGHDDLARAAMPALVGRDPATLDRDAMVRATVESIAENCSDGVLAPLCFLFVGGPVLALAYKAINTLDSMIGYRDARYLYFGRAAARLDDAANFVPARVTALCLAAAAALTLGTRWCGAPRLPRRRAQACEPQRGLSGGHDGGCARNRIGRRCDIRGRNRASRTPGTRGARAEGDGYRNGAPPDAYRDGARVWCARAPALCPLRLLTYDEPRAKHHARLALGDEARTMKSAEQ